MTSSISSKPTVAAVTVFALIAFTLTGAAMAHAEGEIVQAGVVGTGTPGSCTEAALNAALAGGGAVTFNCGGPATITVTSVKSITQPTSIDGGGVITLTGGFATRLFNVANTAALTLTAITIEKGASNGSDGGAISSTGTLVLDEVTIQNSLTDINHSGGAIFSSGPMTVTNSTFSGNSGGSAGAIFANFANAITLIADSTFIGNTAQNATTGFGGAIWMGDNSRLDLRDSVFIGNVAHFGGAIYASANASVTLRGSPSEFIFSSKLQLNGNRATEDGGAIYNRASTVAIDNAVITVNKTPTNTLLAGYGGAIFNAGTLTLTKAVVSQNEGRFGGGLFVGNADNARAYIEGASFNRNVSGNLGGGLYTNILTASVTISATSFHRNTAVGAGGGLARTNSQLKIFNSSFTSNSATDGGAMLVQTLPTGLFGGYIQVRSATFSGNTASNRGGAVFSINSGLELYHATIVSNTNGVYSALNSNTRFRGAVLYHPGGLNCDGDGTAQISDDSGNFSGDLSCPLPNSQTGAGLDPQLGPLTFDQPTGTSYHMPLAGSPLINKGPGSCPARDQIGATRPDACDVGAVEFGGLLDRTRLPIVIR